MTMMLAHYDAGHFAAGHFAAGSGGASGGGGHWIGRALPAHLVYRRATQTAAGVLVAETLGSEASHLVTGASGGEAYFNVKAQSRCGILDREPIRPRRVAFDAAGNLILPAPNRPVGLSLSLGAGGAVIAAWSYVPNGQGAAPTVFRVYVATGETAFDYDTPAASVSAGSRQSFSAALGTFGHATVVRCVVRAEATSGARESNTTEASITADALAPDAPAGIAVEVA